MGKAKKTFDVNDTRAVLSAVVISSVGGVFYNVMPTFLQSLADSLGFDEQQLGFIASAFLLGGVLLSTSGILWMRSVSWRKSVMIAFFLVVFAYGLCLLTTSFSVIVALMFVAGCANGVLYSTALLSISDTEKTERNFGYCIIFGVLLAALGLYSFPVVNSRWGFEGVIGTLIAITALVMVVFPWYPDRGVKGIKTSRGRGAGRVYPVLIGICAMFLFYTGLSAVWAFVGRIADVVGIAATDAGTALAVGMALGAVGAFLAAVVGNRYGNVKPIWMGTVVVIVGILFLVNFRGFFIYTIAVLMIQSGWNFALPVQLAAISTADKSGRFVPLIATAMGCGATVGPGVGGAIILAKGHGSLCAAGVVIIILSLAAFTWLVLLNASADK